MTTPDPARVSALQDLVEHRVTAAASAALLAAFPWDSDELVELTADHLLGVLEDLRAGKIDGPEVVAWADSVDMRDDLGREPGAEDVVNEALVEMSSPELFGDLSETVPGAWAISQR